MQGTTIQNGLKMSEIAKPNNAVPYPKRKKLQRKIFLLRNTNFESLLVSLSVPSYIQIFSSLRFSGQLRFVPPQIS